MHLSGEVPGRIAAALADPAFVATLTGGARAGEIDGWAVHAGGRSILDAVEHALALDPRRARRVARGAGGQRQHVVGDADVRARAAARRAAGASTASRWRSGPASPPRASGSGARHERSRSAPAPRS